MITTGTSGFAGSWSASLYSLSSSLTIALRSDWLNELSKLSYVESSTPKPTSKSSGGFSFPNETPRTCITVSICSRVRWSGVPLVSPISATTRSFCEFAAMCTNVDFPQPTNSSLIESPACGSCDHIQRIQWALRERRGKIGAIDGTERGLRAAGSGVESSFVTFRAELDERSEVKATNGSESTSAVLGLGEV